MSSSSNLKKLMQQKQQSARLTHPQAHYDARGQLSCKTCGTLIKHSSLFSPHLVSKGHRLAVQKSEQASSGKRKRPLNAERGGGTVEGEDDDEDDDEATNEANKRRRAAPEEEDKEEEDDDEPATSGLPSDFFADPSQAPAPTTADDHDQDGVDAQHGDDSARGAAEAEDDPEWAAFEASLAAGSAVEASAPSTAQATIFAAPVEYEFGAPKVDEEGVDGAAAGDDDEEPEETEEERIARQELEEREEIMARIVEEEREQIEADEKVAALKRRMEAMRAARQAKKKSGTTAA